MTTRGPVRRDRARDGAAPGTPVADRSTRSSSASTTTTPTRRATGGSAPPRRSTGARSAPTSPASTAGACTTAPRCPASRSIRTAASRPSPSCAAASSTTPTRSAPRRASARGDVQWLTAGARHRALGDVPAARRRRAEPARAVPDLAEPARADKMVEPHFTMLWARDIPRRRHATTTGAPPRSRSIAGALDGHAPPPPPPDSWAARADADVAIWHARARAGRVVDAARGRGATTTVRVAVLLRGRRLADRRAPTSARRPARCVRADVDVDARGGRRRRRGAACCRAARSASRSRSTARS